MISKIADILREVIPNFKSVELIYTEHYIGYEDNPDKKNHLLLIRNGDFCFAGHDIPFELDTLEITNALEKELPVKVDFDKTLTIQDGNTYKFYIVINEDVAV